MPGLGQHYCIECARYFDSSQALLVHKKGKVHKRRLKNLREEPYTQEEAEAAVNIGQPKQSVASKLADNSNVVMAD